MNTSRAANVPSSERNRWPKCLDGRRPRLAALGRSSLRGVAWVLLVTASTLLSLLIAVWLHSYSCELPEALLEAPPSGKRILDRDGMLLARQSAEGGVFAAPLRLEEAGHQLTEAIVAAEDKRFWTHPGIDIISIGRALVQTLYHGHAVSGASTITQQLARQTFARPRTLAGKWREMALALKIERELSKEQILTHYLNRVHFGPKILGARAAADHYFGKPLKALDLAETATLAGLVRGPSLFDPTRRPERARQQRDRVLSRMYATGAISLEQLHDARSLRVELHPRPPLPGAQHWVRVIAATEPPPLADNVIRSTLHGPLQREVEALVAQHRRDLDKHHTKTSAAAAVVLDNLSGEVLAYVGSPDFMNSRDGGQNDGVQARRQPGSALKPFIYAQAIDELGYTPATFLPDQPTHFKSGGDFYAPRNFDRKFRGSVRLRRALANSLNIPAVYTLEKLGEARVLRKLRELGLDTLAEEATHYGPALALGDGEVTLLDLAAAYAALARGGMTLRPRLRLDASVTPPVAVFSPQASALITEVLSDDAARREAFGAANHLDLPFAVAVKTGTSKGYRDTWTVGYTQAITVAVWAGNFDGSPTDRMTGASAAGPLFHTVFSAVRRVLGPRVSAPGKTRPLHDVALVPQRLCLDSDSDDSSTCPHSFVEWIAADFRTEAGRVDSHSDHTASAAPSQPTDQKLDGVSGPIEDEARLRIVYPQNGMRFRFEPAVPRERQTLMLRTQGAQYAAPGAQGSVPAPVLMLNGAPLKTTQAEGRGAQAEWALSPGKYELYALSGGRRGESVFFWVN